MITLCLPMIFFPEALLRILYSLNEPTVALSLWPMRIIGFTIVFDAISMVLMQSLLGAGDTKRVMLVSICNQWLLFLPIAYIIGPVMGFGLLEIWIYNAVYRAFGALIFLSFWNGKKWTRIRI